jgi:hypothetical protein
MSALTDEILKQYNASDDWLESKRLLWDVYEKLFHNQLADAISMGTNSQVFDPKLPSLILEREARVMAQLATGKVKAISKNDEGASQLMNLTLDKYVIPNANAQFDQLTKYRMVDRYSNIYGNYFVMVDWDIRPNGYQGPDMWLLPIRDVFPQVGAISLDDSDSIIIRSWRTMKFFEDLSKGDGYKNISTIIEKLKGKAGSKQNRDMQHKSAREKRAYPSDEPVKGGGYFEILSRYEKDRWVDYCVDADLEFRDIKNPHDNDELPIVNKYSIPLVDDFMAMGDMERGYPMQNLIDSIWNLYLNAVKISIFPPTLINKDNVADANSIKFSAAAKWLMRNSPGSPGTSGAQTLNLSPQGTNTFNNVYQVATASLLNMFGTTQTSTSSQTDPSFGKTPQALQMQNARENAKDNVDRFYMEQFVTKVNKKYVNLISKKSSGKIQFRMFEDEIKQISQDHPDLAEMYDEKTGKLTIDKKKMGNLIYDYEIVSGSTYAVDQKQQQQNLIGLFTALTNPAVYQLIQGELQKEKKVLNVGEMITRIFSNSGIQDWDKIIVDRTNDPTLQLDQQAQQFQQVLQQMGGVNGVVPQPNQNQPQGQVGQGQSPQMPPQQQQMPQPMPQQGGPLG